MVKITLAKEFTRILYEEVGLGWAIFYVGIAFIMVIVIPYLLLRNKFHRIKDMEDWIINKFTNTFQNS